MDKGQKKKEINDSAQPPPHKGGLKFAPKVPHKKDLKITPKMEIQEESKAYTVDKDLMSMMKLKTSQSMDALGNKAEAEKNESDVSAAKVPKGYTEPWDYIHTNYPVTHPIGKPYSEDPDVSAAKLPKGYTEPCDYIHTSYPVTHPIRRPYSGDPAILDEEEFGQSSSNRNLDGELTAAQELGLMCEMNKPELLFFQLPLSLPLPRAELVTEENTDTNIFLRSHWSDQKKRHQPIQGCRLEELPGGLMGKILVYRSGKVKMKIGEALFDVSPGVQCAFLQEVLAINTREKHCCSLGEISKRVIVTPDINYLLDDMKTE